MKLADTLENLVLISCSSGDERALQAAYLLKSLRPTLTIVMIVHRVGIASFARYLQVGVDGIFKVPDRRESLERVLHLAVEGWKPFPNEIGKVIAEHVAKRFLTPGGSLLTRAEAEVMEGLVRGKRDKEIATDRGIAEGTVHAITTGLFRKCKASSRSELVGKFLPLGETFLTVRRLKPERSALTRRAQP